MRIEDKILEVVKKNMEKKVEFEMEDTIENIGIDSLGIMIITDGIEDEFGIILDRDKLDTEMTINQLVNMIKEKVN